jgi:hypothetical protein
MLQENDTVPEALKGACVQKRKRKGEKIFVYFKCTAIRRPVKHIGFLPREVS